MEQTVGGGWVVDTCGSSGSRFLWGKVCTEEVSTQRGGTYVVPATDTQKTPRSRSEIYSRSLETRIKVIFVFLLLVFLILFDFLHWCHEHSLASRRTVIPPPPNMSRATRKINPLQAAGQFKKNAASLTPPQLGAAVTEANGKMYIDLANRSGPVPAANRKEARSRCLGLENRDLRRKI